MATIPLSYGRRRQEQYH